MGNLLQKAFSLFGDRATADLPDLPEPSIKALKLEAAPTAPTTPPLPSISASQPPVKYQWVYNLTIENCQEFEAMTYPSLQKRWQTYQQRGSMGGVVAISAGQMVGLIIVELLPDRAEILSLYVAPPYRQQGIATQLLSYIEKSLRQLNCPTIHISYQATDLTQQGLERMLHHQGWQTPKTDFLLTKTTIDVIKEAAWVYQYPFPAQFTVFPWVELTAAKRDRILQRQTYPETLSPFTDDPRLEPINSLGLCYQEEVIGWTINHRVANDTIRYSSMFVEAKFQRMGRGFSLLAEAIQRQIKSGIPFLTTAVASDNLPMLQCADRHYKPYATYFSESRSSYKKLS